MTISSQSPRAGCEPTPNYTLTIEEEDEKTSLDLNVGERQTLTVNGKTRWILLTSGQAELNKPYRSKEWLIEAYHSKEMTLAEIADLCGVSAMTINQWLRKHQIPSRPRGRRQP